MLRAILKRGIDKIERQFGYDASYMRYVLKVDPTTLAKFSILTGLVDRKAAPGEALAAAGIAATLAEDCGPCTQISVDIAEKGGGKPAVLRAILAEIGRASWRERV